MQYIKLCAGIPEVSRLCFGSLTVSPLQAALSVDEGSDVIAYAIEHGVNFIDTAQYYRNYDYIKQALKKTGKYDTVITSKSYAYNRELASKAFDEACRGIDRDYIDIFMLHEQESIHTLRGHAEALDFFFEMKAKGRIGAVGISTHHIAGVYGACECIYPIDVIHPIYNYRGLGIVDGTAAEMATAIEVAHGKGMGVYAMKALGGGNMLSDAAKCFEFVLSTNGIGAVAVGMQSCEEVDANIGFFEKGAFSVQDEKALSLKQRHLHIEEYCEGCGACVNKCHQNALTLVGGKAFCNDGACLKCGYCSAVCPVFAIKVI